MEAARDEIDEKLARIQARIDARHASTRAELERIGFLDVAEALRETFGARLGYLHTDRITIGTDPPRGQPATEIRTPAELLREDWRNHRGRR